jgi:hypothetical protein
MGELLPGLLSASRHAKNSIIRILAGDLVSARNKVSVGV